MYLAGGARGEIIIWDVETKSVFKVFNYLDSFPSLTKKIIKNFSAFIGILLFKHLNRVLILGGTERGAICWDFDTNEVIYEITMPSKPTGGYLSKYCKLNMNISLSIMQMKSLMPMTRVDMMTRVIIS